MFYKKGALKNCRNWQLICNFIKKGTPTQVFSPQFCEIFKSTVFTAHLRVTTSDLLEKAFQLSALARNTGAHSSCPVFDKYQQISKNIDDLNSHIEFFQSTEDFQ